MRRRQASHLTLVDVDVTLNLPASTRTHLRQSIDGWHSPSLTADERYVGRKIEIDGVTTEADHSNLTCTAKAAFTAPDTTMAQSPAGVDLFYTVNCDRRHEDRRRDISGTRGKSVK